MWLAVNASFHPTSFIVLPQSLLIHLLKKTEFWTPKQVNLAWIQHFQDKETAWIQHFQDSYIFGSSESWKCWIQAKKFFFSFFAHFEIWGRSNCCTNRFVLKNCTSDRKMKKIKRYSFWVFSKKPETLCKKGLKTLKMLNSRPKSWIQHFQGPPAAMGAPHLSSGFYLYVLTILLCQISLKSAM